MNEFIYMTDLIKSKLSEIKEVSEQVEEAIIGLKNIKSKSEILHIKLKDITLFMNILDNKVRNKI
jgi:hypothetical protein